MLKKYVISCVWGFCVGMLSFSANASSSAHFYSEPTAFSTTTSPFYANTTTPHTQVVSPFTTLIVDGNANLDIQTGQSPSSITVNAYQNDLMHVHIQEVNDTLKITFDSGYPRDGLMHIVVSTPFLNKLIVKNSHGQIQGTNLNSSYFDADVQTDNSVRLSGHIGLHHLVVRGNATVQIQDVKSSSLKVWMQDNATVDLTGMANLKSLNASGSGKLRFYWVDSNFLRIRQSGTTQVELAGIAKIVDVELSDQAYFNGRYLRAQKGYAKTFDNSKADVQFLNSQSTLANDNSLISTYGKPSYENNFMGKNGAVLNLTNSQ